MSIGDAKTVLTVRICFISEQQHADLNPFSQGKDLMKVASAPEQPGPWTGRALAQVMEWQLEHPDGTKEECAGWLDERFAKGLIDISSDPPANQKRVKSGEGNTTKKMRR